MTLQQLNYFCLVAELQSINKVAQQVHVSEPALSKSIHLLEQELNVRLFNRSGRKLKLNENGVFFTVMFPPAWKGWRRPLTP